MENWQLCPKCKGENVGRICPVCNNTGIISVFTGLPPNKPIPTLGDSTGEYIVKHPPITSQ